MTLREVVPLLDHSLMVDPMLKTAPRIIPPLYLFASIVVMGLLARFAPIRMIMPETHTYVGFICIAVALIIGFPSAAAFRRAGTVLRPGPGSAAFVTEGAYKFTRNPMYLGFVLLALGVAFLLGAVSPFFVPPILAGILHTQFIVHEEQWMEDRFADEYVRYKARVRRWL